MRVIFLSDVLAIKSSFLPFFSLSFLIFHLYDEALIPPKSPIFTYLLDSPYLLTTLILHIYLPP